MMEKRHSDYKYTHYTIDILYTPGTRVKFLDDVWEFVGERKAIFPLSINREPSYINHWKKVEGK